MSNFHLHFIDEVIASQNCSAFQVGARVRDGLLRVELTLRTRAFNCRRAIDEWMFDCTLRFRRKAPGTSRLPLFRGIDESLRDRALRNGIDVEPTDMHWYGADLEKALEYGGDYPHVLIIDGDLAQRRFRSVAIDAPESAHLEAREWSGGPPIPSANGAFLHYSRLPITDSRRGSDYETAHAWFLPGDAREAFLGIIECRPAGDAP